MYLVGKKIYPDNSIEYWCLHPKIAKVYDYSQTEFNAMLEMDLVQNADAKDEDLLIYRNDTCVNKLAFIGGKRNQQYCVLTNFGVFTFYDIDSLRAAEEKGLRIANAIYDREYNAYHINIPYYDNTESYEIGVARYKRRLYEVYCDYISNGKSKRKPKPFDTFDINFAKYIMKVYHKAEYIDWMIVLTEYMLLCQE